MRLLEPAESVGNAGAIAALEIKVHEKNHRSFQISDHVVSGLEGKDRSNRG